MTLKKPDFSRFRDPKSQVAVLAWESLRASMLIRFLIEKELLPEGWPEGMPDKPFSRLNRTEKRYVMRWASKSLIAPSGRERALKLKDLGFKPSTALRALEIMLVVKESMTNRVPKRALREQGILPRNPSQTTRAWSTSVQVQKHFIERIFSEAGLDWRHP